MLGYVESCLCLNWIKTRPDIKVIQFLMRDFLRLNLWSEGLGLGPFLSSLEIRCVKYKYCYFKLRFGMLFYISKKKKKNYIIALCIISVNVFSCVMFDFSFYVLHLIDMRIHVNFQHKSYFENMILETVYNCAQQ